MKCLIRFLLDIYQIFKTGHLCLDQHKYALAFITFAQNYPHWAIRIDFGIFVLLTADSSDTSPSNSSKSSPLELKASTVKPVLSGHLKGGPKVGS